MTFVIVTQLSQIHLKTVVLIANLLLEILDLIDIANDSGVENGDFVVYSY
jgi:hypothetical protein